MPKIIIYSADQGIIPQDVYEALQRHLNEELPLWSITYDTDTPNHIAFLSIKVEDHVCTLFTSSNNTVYTITDHLQATRQTKCPHCGALNQETMLAHQLGGALTLCRGCLEVY